MTSEPEIEGGMTLAGRTAVVTGASSGVGRAIALALARKQARLIVLGRRQDALDEVVRQAQAATGSARAVSLDLLSDRAITDFAADLAARGERVDILVHSAGAVAVGLFEDAPIEDLDRQYAANLRAPFLLTQALLPSMPCPGGQIVFLNSSVGLQARSTVSQYAATKQGLRALADALREEVNDRGIRVLSVFLGRTATPMQAAVHAWEGRLFRPETLLQPEDVASVVVHALALPMTAEVTDVRIRPMRKLGTQHPDRPAR